MKVKWSSGGDPAVRAAPQRLGNEPHEARRAARSQNLLLAINPFREVGGPKGRLFQLIWSRPAGQGCQEVAPSLETSPTASDKRTDAGSSRAERITYTDPYINLDLKF